MTTSDSSEKTESDGKLKKGRCIKVVMRRLPYWMTEEEILSQIGAFSSLESHRFVRPLDSTGTRNASFSRIYLLFRDPLEAIELCNRFNHFVFIDSSGAESAAIVEYAPNEKFSKSSRADTVHDKKINTIEEEPEYKRFVEDLENAAKAETLSVEEQLSLLMNKKSTSSYVETPLTQHMMRRSIQRGQKIDEKRAREADRKAKLQRLLEKQKAERQAREKIKILKKTDEAKPSKSKEFKEPKEPSNTTRQPEQRETRRPPPKADKPKPAPKAQSEGGAGPSRPPRERPPRAARTQAETADSGAPHGDKKKRPEREIYRPGRKKDTTPK